MQLANQIHQNDVDQMMAFYKQTFHRVSVITCTQCGTPLAFELADSITGDTLGLQPNEIGDIIIPVGDDLLSSRVRLDEHHPGKRMMGYQCGAPVPNPLYLKASKDHEKAVATYRKQYDEAVTAAQKAKTPEPEYQEPVLSVPKTLRCGNNTILCEPEKGLVPVGGQPVGYSNPFEKHQIAQAIKTHPTYKPDFEEHGNIRRYETFTVERL